VKKEVPEVQKNLVQERNSPVK